MVDKSELCIHSTKIEEPPDKFIVEMTKRCERIDAGLPGLARD
jgi:hypothetical protein